MRIHYSRTTGSRSEKRCRRAEQYSESAPRRTGKISECSATSLISACSEFTEGTAHTDQNNNFRANCIWRAAKALLIFPETSVSRVGGRIHVVHVVKGVEQFPAELQPHRLLDRKVFED